MYEYRYLNQSFAINTACKTIKANSLDAFKICIERYKNRDIDIYYTLFIGKSIIQTLVDEKKIEFINVLLNRYKGISKEILLDYLKKSKL